MAAPYLASDVMNQAAAILNDTGLAVFSFVAQLPYLKMANEDLELILIACGVSIQRQVGAVLSVPASTTDNDLSGVAGYPSDMFFPIRLWESPDGSVGSFNLMTEKDWTPEVRPTAGLIFWAFRNNKIYTPGSTSARSVKIDYWRQLTSIISSSSNEEVAGALTYLAAKTAELCARFIGQNTDIADALLNGRVAQCQDVLERIYIKNTQGTRSRRRRFRRPGSQYTR